MTDENVVGTKVIKLVNKTPGILSAAKIPREHDDDITPQNQTKHRNHCATQRYRNAAAARAPPSARSMPSLPAVGAGAAAPFFAVLLAAALLLLLAAAAALEIEAMMGASASEAAWM